MDRQTDLPHRRDSAALLDDIDRLTERLSECLARQEGPELVALMGRVRALSSGSSPAPVQAEDLRSLLSEVG
ncbi:MAG: hypothetical protein ACRDZQ_14265, partial [Acidimicrobiales bacterium]